MPDPKIDEGFFSARDGLRLFRHGAQPVGTPVADVAVLHGYAEHLGRHEEVTRALCGAGYAVHLFDCRGHGQSGGKRAHVDSFDEYLQDLDVFLARGDAPLGEAVLDRGEVGAGEFLFDFEHAWRPKGLHDGEVAR